MRIISGKYRGKVLFPGKKFRARPTTDFAKEGLFNILNNEYDFEEISVLDLFSGTGSIGIEFASRGCAHIVSVESDPGHSDFIRKIATDLRFDGFRVVRADVYRFIRSCSEQFDIVFADPPYHNEDIVTLPDLIFTKYLVKPGGYFILEHSGKYEFSDSMFYSDIRRYGNVHFTFFKPDFQR